MEKTAPTNPQDRRTAGTVLWPLLLLPILYLLSYGPVVVLAEGSGNQNLLLTVVRIYEPIGWLHKTPLRVPLEKYYELCGGGK